MGAGRKWEGDNSCIVGVEQVIRGGELHYRDILTHRKKSSFNRSLMSIYVIITSESLSDIVIERIGKNWFSYIIWNITNSLTEWV